MTQLCRRWPITVSLVAASVLTAGCGATSSLSPGLGFGPRPELPPPDTSLLPTVNVVKAIGWAPNQTPTAAEGLAVTAFARDLDHPRWLFVLPNGDVLVAETNAPARQDDGGGIRGWFVRRYQRKAGGVTPSADRITLLRDTDADGIADVRTVFLSGLRSPFGMALVGDDLYVANTDAIVRVPYARGETRISAEPTKVIDLPAGPRDHHWTKNIIASPDGAKIYIAIGSNSNAAEHGLSEELDRARIWELHLRTGMRRTFATGLRNPVGMAWAPRSQTLWTAVNERDELGNDLVPDYMTSVREGGFYGWPFSYFGSHVDARVKPQRPDLVATAIAPDYALGAHTASLGLAAVSGDGPSARLSHGMFVGQHGSWNRKPRSGFKVIFVPFLEDQPSGPPSDVLTGFVTDKGEAMGRPVGVAIDLAGGLLVADDVGNAVWRVAEPRPPMPPAN
jgi:glucose/arabinose dehydrogenase